MKPLNFEVVEKAGESQDKMIRKFLKKTSRNKLVQDYIERMYFQSKSSKGRDKKSRKKYIKQNIKILIIIIKNKKKYKIFSYLWFNTLSSINNIVNMINGIIYYNNPYYVPIYTNNNIKNKYLIFTIKKYLTIKNI